MDRIRCEPAVMVGAVAAVSAVVGVTVTRGRHACVRIACHKG
jgi:hypothetical protein